MSENKNNNHTDDNNDNNTEIIENVETTEKLEETIEEIHETGDSAENADTVIEEAIKEFESADEDVLKIENEPKKRGAFKDSIIGTAAILAIICVVIVYTISLLNAITAPIIAQRLSDERDAAIERLFGANILFMELNGYEDMYSDFEAPVMEIYIVVDQNRIGDDKIAGYCVIVAPKGFTDSIIMLVAVNPNLTVKDTLILSMSETVGYGTRLESEGESWFREKFRNKSRNIRDVKNTPSSDDNAVQILAGATVSSRAFLRGVNAALDIMNEIINQPQTGETAGDEIPDDAETEETENTEEEEDSDE